MTHYYQICVRAHVSKLFTYKTENVLNLGTRVRVKFRNSLKTGIVIRESEMKEVKTIKPEKIKAIFSVMDSETLISQHSIVLAEWMAMQYCCSLPEALFSIVPSGVKTTITDQETIMLSSYTGTKTSLTEEQSRGLNTLQNQNSYALKYLYGVAGGGKTEVFVSLTEFVASLGRQVIYLVPEIGLVSQLYPYLVRRIGEENVVCYHSGLVQSKRLDAWKRFSDGRAKVVIGTRSAIACNFFRPGYIIMDEEHDSSYKSDQKPRIHARDIAIKRAQLLNIPFVCGSATPSIEAWNYFRTRDKDLILLTKKYSEEEAPRIVHQCIDTVKGVFSPLLKSEIKRTLDNKEQVLLFVNRKGFANAFFCLSCGSSQTCKHCSVNMTYHSTTQRLVCHHCGYTCALPSRCYACKSISLGIRGYGTHRVKEEVMQLFPEAIIEVLDADSSQPAKILEQFYKGTIDILIGTQIMAKGITIPKLSLVGVLFLESFFAMPDFRSIEKGHALLTQIIGRVGRVKQASKQSSLTSRGSVLLQSFTKDNEHLNIIRAQDYRAFLDKEIEVRTRYQLPPSRNLTRILVRSKDRDKALSIARKLIDIVNDICKEHTQQTMVLGPNPCPIERRSEQYRIQIYLNVINIQIARKLVTQLLENERVKVMKRNRDYFIDIDLTPTSNL